MRGAYLRGNLAALTVLGPSNAQLIRAAVRGSTIDQIEAPGDKTWLPLDLDVELTEAVGRLCGAHGLATWCQASLRTSVQSPLLGPIVSGAARVFGADPRAMIGLVPRAWAYVYRNAGRVRMPACEASGPSDPTRRVTLVYEDAPAAVFESAWYLEGVGAALGVILELCGARGFVSVDRHGAETRLRFEWTRGPAERSAGGLDAGSAASTR